MSLEGLQRYQIMEALGRGSQGHTFAAIDRETGEQVAVKVLSLEAIDGWKAFDLFEREARVLAGLQHPGIPRYRDYFTSEGSGDYFLVMDEVRGPSLAEEMRRVGAFDEARLRRIASGLLEILAYLHSRTPPVIHRDIKPANVMLGGEGDEQRVFLVDFGGVRIAGHGGGGSTMIGTIGYMAPEQLHGDAGPGVDLYALGATLVTLATGTPADELPHLGLAMDLDALVLPEGLRPFLSALLRPDPRERLSKVSDAQRLLASDSERPDAPAPGTQTQTQTQTLAIPSSIQELAQMRRPMSVFVWLFAMLGAAGVIVFEYAILPLLYLLLRAVADNKQARGEAVDEKKAGITSVRDLRKRATRQRQLIQYVIQGTSPLRDDPPALPPAEGP